MSPKKWGKQGWHFIHCVALSYPASPTEIDKQNYLAFFKSLENVLPCSSCADNFRKKMEKNPPDLKNSITLFKWTVDIHNSINAENGKKEISPEEALEKITYKFSTFQIAASVSIAMLIVGVFWITKKK